MRRQLELLREKMKEKRIDYYLIPTTDFHGSEQVNDYFKCRQYISGFTGSAGDMIVTADRAGLWTDGRYFLQAEAQLAGTGIELMKMGQENVPKISEYLYENMEKGQTLGFDGRIVSGENGLEFERLLAEKNVLIMHDLDLVGDIWKERPQISPSAVYKLPLEVTGCDTGHKLAEMRKIMAEKGAEYCLMTNLEEIAWLFNLRGSDIENTPVFFSFAMLTSRDVTLYINKEALNPALVDQYVILKDYPDINEDIKTIPEGVSIIVNAEQANYSLVKNIPEKVKIISEPTPAQQLKAVKNHAEITCTKNAHLKDGAAMVNFIYWLKNNVGKIPMTEITAADYLEECRRRQDGCFDLSFPTIAGYAEHGAIIHYQSTPDTDVSLQPKGFLLVDSGGQYNDGTTDITRTIALGPLTDKMKKYYTAVLKSHIRLALMRFAPETKGNEMDRIVREPILAVGENYNHGTGHGVGHILSVHEGPNSISPRNSTQSIWPGMITSDEPGIYIENEFGIRLENEILCVEGSDGKYQFETITFCPFDREAVIAEEMTEEELDFLNNYHKEVYEKISTRVDENVKKWLFDATREIRP